MGTTVAGHDIEFNLLDFSEKLSSRDGPRREINTAHKNTTGKAEKKNATLSERAPSHGSDFGCSQRPKNEAAERQEKTRALRQLDSAATNATNTRDERSCMIVLIATSSFILIRLHHPHQSPATPFVDYDRLHAPLVPGPYYYWRVACQGASRQNTIPRHPRHLRSNRQCL